MCRRPSCCQPPSHEGAGIAAVAVVIGGAYAYAKIGPAVARIWHLAVEAVIIFTLGCAAFAAGIVITWATAHYIRTRRTRRQAVLVPVQAAASWPEPVQEASEPGCLSCGDSGTVLRAIGPSSYQDSSCPACQPVHRAG
jgi:hypothetical protein